MDIKSCDAALKQAQELDKLAQQIGEIISGQNKLQSDSTNYWKGKSADAARQALASDAKQMQKIQNELTKTAKNIRMVVKEFKEKDASLANRIRRKLGV